MNLCRHGSDEKALQLGIQVLTTQTVSLSLSTECVCGTFVQVRYRTSIGQWYLHIQKFILTGVQIISFYSLSKFCLTRIGFQSGDSTHVKRISHSKHGIPDLHPFLLFLSSFSGGGGGVEEIIYKTFNVSKYQWNQTSHLSFLRIKWQQNIAHSNARVTRSRRHATGDHSVTWPHNIWCFHGFSARFQSQRTNIHSLSLSFIVTNQTMWLICDFTLHKLCSWCSFVL
jgi:hypothetical protein